MLDHLTAHWPPAIKNRPARTRRAMIGAAITPQLLSGVLSGVHPGPPADSGLVACTYPLATQDVPAADYIKIRAQFAGSRWPDLRATHGTPTDTRPSGSTSGYPPPAPSTDRP